MDANFSFFGLHCLEITVKNVLDGHQYPEQSPMKLIKEEVVIQNELGLHARAAALIAKAAQNAKNSVWLEKGSQKVNAGSIIDILTLEGTKGSKINIMIENQQDMEILIQITKLVSEGFGEQNQ